jgi:hypothetical protein
MKLSAEIKMLIRNRQAALWVCQQYDLLDETKPHDLGLPLSDATLLYRSDINECDIRLANLYWNTIWLEGASSSILKHLHNSEREPTGAARKLVVLASSSDESADISNQTYLPVYVLPGLLDTGAPDSRYGSMSQRARASLAWKFGCKISLYPGNVLIIIGAQNASDLDFVKEILTEIPVRDLSVVILWSNPDLQAPSLDDLSAKLYVVSGTLSEFVDVLYEAGAPKANEIFENKIRVGQRSILLTSQETEFISKRMHIFFESAFKSPENLSIENLEAFFDLSVSDWSCYASGLLPIPRSYRTDEGLTLTEEILSKLNDISGGAVDTQIYVYQLPAEAAAGVTTLIQETAFEVAKAGHPTLLAKRDQVTLEIEDILAFFTSLNDAVQNSGLPQLPPVLIVLDVDHHERNEVLARQMAQSLSAHGRRAVILQAVSCEEELKVIKTNRFEILPKLSSTVADEELVECANRFSGLSSRWGLGVGNQELEDWKQYRLATQIQGPNGALNNEALFWIAVRFFVLEGSDIMSMDSLRDSLNLWITKRTSDVESEESQQMLKFIAAFSSFRIMSPMMTVLRPIYGQSFSTNITDTLRELRDIVDWKDYSEDLNDQLLTFRHPAIADEYLRAEGYNTTKEKVLLVKAVLSNLSPGGKADVWLAETLSAKIFDTDERDLNTDWSWRIAAFELFPFTISHQSRTIMHHWALALYRSTKGSRQLEDDQYATLNNAIKKLEEALLLERKPGGGEHAGIIYNTLGTINSELAIYLDQAGKDREAAEKWEIACSAFESALEVLPGENIVPLLAFSYRLLSHAGVYPSKKAAISDDSFKSVAKAISLLDEAEDAINGTTVPDPRWRTELIKYKAAALEALGDDEANKFIERLKLSDEPSLGYYCEARLRFGKDDDFESAIVILNDAMEVGVKMGSEALKFLIFLYTRSRTFKNNFRAQLDLYRQLENVTASKNNLVDRFRLAVLCYQTGSFGEGGERFRKIRQLARSMQSNSAPQRVSAFLKDENGDDRVLHIRVDKVLTEWRGEGYVEAIEQTIPLRPRHFTPIARKSERRDCKIKFQIWGPLAVPARVR